MQRALIRARNLFKFTNNGVQFSTHGKTQPDVWATKITLDNKAKALEIEFNTGERFKYPAELLRVESPAANSSSHSFSKNTSSTLPPIVHGRRYVGILDVEPVGRYAIRIQFDDLHNTGIFTWPYLHKLGLEKYKRMRQYITSLKQQGLSRDPRPLRRIKIKDIQGDNTPNTPNTV